MQRTRARKLAATIDGLFRTQGEGFATSASTASTVTAMAG